MPLKRMLWRVSLESSDALVTVEPAEQGIELEISSSVMNQYGRQIRQTVLKPSTAST